MTMCGRCFVHDGIFMLNEVCYMRKVLALIFVLAMMLTGCDSTKQNSTLNYTNDNYDALEHGDFLN